MELPETDHFLFSPVQSTEKCCPIQHWQEPASGNFQKLKMFAGIENIQDQKFWEEERIRLLLLERNTWDDLNSE